LIILIILGEESTNIACSIYDSQARQRLGRKTEYRLRKIVCKERQGRVAKLYQKIHVGDAPTQNVLIFLKPPISSSFPNDVMVNPASCSGD
jgi:hypothetical protein